MTITTNYKCDKCGAIQDTPVQFWEVGVYARVVNTTFTANLGTKVSSKFEMQVCRQCLEMFGIHPTKQTEQMDNYNPPTLEDLITEIVHNAMSDR